MTRILYPSICLFPLLLLCGCMPKPEATLTPTQAAQSAKTLSSWEARGLLGVRQHQKAWSAQMVWTQQGPHQYHLRLFGPLGGGSVLIDRVGNQITYQDDKKKISATNASGLLKQQTGIQLPVDSLYYWARGLPAPGSIESAHYNENHELIQLQQFGYQIDYGTYQTVGAYHLPTSLKLKNSQLLAKLVIKQWKV